MVFAKMMVLASVMPALQDLPAKILTATSTAVVKITVSALTTSVNAVVTGRDLSARLTQPALEMEILLTWRANVIQASLDPPALKP
jgi:hypothetical protein